MKTELVKK